MKIAIVGPGAIGCLFAGMLSRGGHEVWLIDHRPDRARRLDRHGVWVSGVSGEFSGRVRATADPATAGPCELVVLTVKSYDTQAAAPTAASLIGPRGVALTLQNGIGNLEILQRAAGEERVIGGTTAQAATLIAPGQVHHAGDGVTVIGEPTGELTERLAAVSRAFASAGLHTEFTTDLTSVLWSKLAVNAGINPVATIAQVRNGGILESAHLRQVLRAAVLEVEAVARGRRIRLSPEDIAAHAEGICQRTANNVNSMLQDVNRKRRTEIDAINGAVVREGEALGVPTPVNRLLFALIHGIEDTYAARAAY
jgi:2-dehydropantoate 2-reductase